MGECISAAPILGIMRLFSCSGKKCANREGAEGTGDSRPGSAASRRFLPPKLSLQSRRASTRTSLLLSPSLLIRTSTAWALTGSRRRATLGFTTIRRQAISACLLRESPTPPHPSSKQLNSNNTTNQLTARSQVAQPLTRTAPLSAFALWIALCRSVLTTPSRPTRMTTAIGQMRLHNRLAQRAGGKPCLPIFTRSVNLVPCTPSLLPAAIVLPSQRQTTAPLLESPTHTGFGHVSDGKSPQRPVACDLCAGRLLVLQRHDLAGQLPCGHPARLRSPQQGHLGAQLLVCAAHPVQAQVCFLGRRGHGCHWQVPQSSRQVALLFHGRQHPCQQRVRQAEFSLCLQVRTIDLLGSDLDRSCFASSLA